ncbi:hypothetical protein [uncultured Limosilactobacillus sp.]|uniref:hypothetical protein n=1 Tax=uncultured Limosilactobacillus sp. TaxID=2837629 RepID=UPI0025F38FDA|nr:hypothetical protein [uncultured Limosilactobacillus sp.]
MNNDNNQFGTDEHLTRTQYRRQMKHRRGLFGHHQNEDVSSEGQQSSHDDLDAQPTPEPAAATAQMNDESPTPNRAASVAMDQEAVAEEKSQRLARKLNIVIAVLVALIVVVYLVLFFVG